MANQQDVKIRIDYIYEGMELGSKAGFQLSTLYAVLGAFLVEVFWRESGYLAWLERTNFAWQILIAIVFMIFFIAIGPATILGTLTGLLLGQFAKIFYNRSKYFLVFSSAFLCIMIAVMIHIFFGIKIVFSFQPSPTIESDFFSMGIYGTYPFFMGIPTVLYVLAGGWTGWQLYLKSLSQRDE